MATNPSALQYLLQQLELSRLNGVVSEREAEINRLRRFEREAEVGRQRVNERDAELERLRASMKKRDDQWVRAYRTGYSKPPERWDVFLDGINVPRGPRDARLSAARGPTNAKRPREESAIARDARGPGNMITGAPASTGTIMAMTQPGSIIPAFLPSLVLDAGAGAANDSESDSVALACTPKWSLPEPESEDLEDESDSEPEPLPPPPKPLSSCPVMFPFKKLGIRLKHDVAAKRIIFKSTLSPDSPASKLRPGDVLYRIDRWNVGAIDSHEAYEEAKNRFKYAPRPITLYFCHPE